MMGETQHCLEQRARCWCREVGQRMEGLDPTGLQLRVRGRM